MNLRRAEKGQLPPGTSENHLDDLDIEDEPPGGLWQAEGMTGPGVAPQERWAKGCEPTKEEDEDESEGEGEEAEELPTWIIKAAQAREKRKDRQKREDTSQEEKTSSGERTKQILMKTQQKSMQHLKQNCTCVGQGWKRRLMKKCLMCQDK